MGIFSVSEKLKRKANLCHLLVSHISEQELIDNYGYSKEDILTAKEDIHKFDDNAYLHGNIKRAFHKR